MNPRFPLKRWLVDHMIPNFLSSRLRQRRMSAFDDLIAPRQP